MIMQPYYYRVPLFFLLFFVLGSLNIGKAYASTIQYNCSSLSAYGSPPPTCSAETATWSSSSGGIKGINDYSGFYQAGNTYYVVTNSTLSSGSIDFYISGDVNANVHNISTSGVQNFTVNAPSGNSYYVMEMDGNGATGGLSNTSEVVCVSDTSFAECAGSPPAPGVDHEATTTLDKSTDILWEGFCLFAIGLCIPLWLHKRRD